jgi:hypothetical protein
MRHLLTSLRLNHRQPRQPSTAVCTKPTCSTAQRLHILPAPGTVQAASTLPAAGNIHTFAAVAVRLVLHAYPAGVELHDDGKGRVGCEDDVVDHGGVVAHPHRILASRRPWPMVPTSGNHQVLPHGCRRPGRWLCRIICCYQMERPSRQATGSRHPLLRLAMTVRLLVST